MRTKYAVIVVPLCKYTDSKILLGMLSMEFSLKFLLVWRGIVYFGAYMLIHLHPCITVTFNGIKT